MNSRERVIAAINHRVPDRIPLDLGSSPVTGISASVLYKLRHALGLEEKPVTAIAPCLMLGYVEDDVRKALGVDTIGLWKRTNNFGLRNENWQKWKMPDGTPVYMPGGFAYDIRPDGSIVAYPQGDKSVQPSAIMPKDGSFFSGINRAKPIDEEHLNPIADFKEQFQVFTDEDARWLEEESVRLYEDTNYAVVGIMSNGSFGDVLALYGIGLKKVTGIRTLDEWLVAHLLHPDYIEELFEYQTEVYLKNLQIYHQAVGERIQVLYASGVDFGMQTGELISPELFRKFYKPCWKRITDWVHRNTGWKVMFHTCGSIVNLLDDIAESGIDILNPVQCSARGMDPVMLKEKYGDRFVFWGGGVNTQETLPFGSVDKVKNEVEERIRIFSKDGGFVFNTIHNIVAKTPIENLMAMYDVVKTFKYDE